MHGYLMTKSHQVFLSFVYAHLFFIFLRDPSSAHKIGLKISYKTNDPG